MTTNKPNVQRYTDMGSETICPINNLRKSDDGNYVLYEDYEALQAECEKLHSKTRVSLGVGDGGGSLFVHGDYDSIKRVQALIFECEKLVEALERARTYIDDCGAQAGAQSAIDDIDAALAAHRKQEVL